MRILLFIVRLRYLLTTFIHGIVQQVIAPFLWFFTSILC